MLAKVKLSVAHLTADEQGRLAGASSGILPAH